MSSIGPVTRTRNESLEIQMLKPGTPGLVPAARGREPEIGRLVSKVARTTSRFGDESLWDALETFATRAANLSSRS